ncbi:MAG TPA: CHAP domain-containing protein [Actinoallomurus sp.]|nr:CHAP domain-containing protein [Actinoallomurus sp.]
MGTATGMIKVGRTLLGTTEHPDGSNHAPPITTEYGFDGAWCDMSVTYEANHSANLPAVGGRFAYVPAHAQWFKSKGRFHSGKSGIKAGDIVFYNWSRRKGTTLCDHVGLVEKVFSDGSFYSLEGNTSDAFRRQHRDSTYVSGYGRPVYTSTTQEDDMQPKDKLPVGAWMKSHWKTDKGITDGTMLVETTLTSGYGHSRAAHENTDELVQMVTALQKTVTTLAATVADMDARIKAN